jgi:3-hydroxybutyryl-CoA dehydrogenase
LEELKEIELAVAVTSENVGQKREIINIMEKVLAKDALIGINSESIPLSHIQQNSSVPERIIGLNWVEPANTTVFLEVISNNRNGEEEIESLLKLAKENWRKDPYVLKNDKGIRSKLLGALVREAFYLIENEYVKVEDIDRACRNDAGYYLPFAGNCRYMDLMGTSVYGTVMADLNPELSKATHIPSFFLEIVDKGGKGMENGKGFYAYSKSEEEKINRLFQRFSHQIREIMSNYPFPHPKTETETPVGKITGEVNQKSSKDKNR